MKKFDKTDANLRLQAVSDYIDRIFDEGRPMLTSTAGTLLYVQAICLGTETEYGMSKQTTIKLFPIIISCDASIKVNPGGPSSVGVVIDMPEHVESIKSKRKLEIAQKTPATSNNQAEYDAVYFGLTTLMDLKNNPGCKVEVHSDSQLVIRQINGDMKCKDESLKKRRDINRELIQTLPLEVELLWKPRNSTPGLEMANFLAQDLLGVRRH
jgi:ribonuclease HI